MEIVADKKCTTSCRTEKPRPRAKIDTLHRQDPGGGLWPHPRLCPGYIQYPRLFQGCTKAVPSTQGSTKQPRLYLRLCQGCTKDVPSTQGCPRVEPTLYPKLYQHPWLNQAVLGPNPGCTSTHGCTQCCTRRYQYQTLYPRPCQGCAQAVPVPMAVPRLCQGQTQGEPDPWLYPRLYPAVPVPNAVPKTVSRMRPGCTSTHGCTKAVLGPNPGCTSTHGCTQ